MSDEEGATVGLGLKHIRKRGDLVACGVPTRVSIALVQVGRDPWPCPKEAATTSQKCTSEAEEEHVICACKAVLIAI